MIYLYPGEAGPVYGSKEKKNRPDIRLVARVGPDDEEERDDGVLRNIGTERENNATAVLPANIAGRAFGASARLRGACR